MIKTWGTGPLHFRLDTVAKKLEVREGDHDPLVWTYAPDLTIVSNGVAARLVPQDRGWQLNLADGSVTVTSINGEYTIETSSHGETSTVEVPLRDQVHSDIPLTLLENDA